MTFKKTVGPNGTVITMDLWKAGSQEVLSRSLGGFVSTAWAKRLSKGCLFENHENRTWHLKKQIVSKNGAVSKNTKINETLSEIQCLLKVQNHWKTLKQKHFSWFSIIQKNYAKRDRSGTLKVRHGPPMFDLSSDFWCFVMPSRSTKKLGRGAPKGRQRDIGYSPAPSFRTAGVPRVNWK